MAIPDEDVAAVRAQTDIVALIGEHLSLRRQGRRFVGLCPFHTEKTPSFSVNPEQGLYYCFGCQASGDAITFLRAVEHLDFAEAVERLAARAGVTLHQQPGGGRIASSHRERLLAAMEAAVDFYHERLLQHRDAGPARVYLRSRGYDERTVRMFRLGWAPVEWDALVRALRFPADILADAGLSFVNRAGRRQDVFRARVIFPIFDPGGRAIALGGRVLPEGSAEPPPGPSPAASSDGPAQGPKYRNSAETPIYSKRRTLYGLNWAKANVIDKGEVVVCEGYTDVIAFHQAGVPRAVATCGTALAEDHVRALRNFAGRVVLAYDADTAGQAAAERFYEWERRFELDIAVADLPAGTDPADLGARDPAALRTAVETARPYLDFQVERVLSSADLRTAEGRAKAAEAALEAVAEHPRALVRDQYVMRIADRCRFDSSTLRPLLERKRREARAREVRPAGAGRSPGRASSATLGVGEEALRLAIHRPGEVAEHLEEVLFTNPVQRAAFRALAESVTLHQAVSSAEPEAAALLGRLAVEDTDADAREVVARLARSAAEQALAELLSLARSLPEERAGELMGQASWLRLLIETLGGGADGMESTGRLVAWLSRRGEKGTGA